MFRSTAAGPPPRRGILLDSDVPPGAGLSSSAAIECAVALAVDELLGSGIPRGELVLVCQRAENDFVGAPTGILDQSAALLGTAGHACSWTAAAGTHARSP